MAIHAQQVYQQNQIYTANPQELVLMLYNGGIKFLKLAKQSIEEEKMGEAHDYLIRVQDILTELELGLNREMEIAKHMATLYDFMKWRVVQANMKKDVAMVDEVLQFFTEFRDTWKQAMELAKQQPVKKGN